MYIRREWENLKERDRVNERERECKRDRGRQKASLRVCSCDSVCVQKNVSKREVKKRVCGWDKANVLHFGYIIVCCWVRGRKGVCTSPALYCRHVCVWERIKVRERDRERVRVGVVCAFVCVVACVHFSFSIVCRHVCEGERKSEKKSKRQKIRAHTRARE